MSSAKEKTNLQQVFVELLDEGTLCIRPTLAQPLGQGQYRLLPTIAYDPQIEHWQFPPGTVVRCRKEHWGGATVLVARERVPATSGK